jgi:hypothetical protein
VELLLLDTVQVARHKREREKKEQYIVDANGTNDPEEHPECDLEGTD